MQFINKSTFIMPEKNIIDYISAPNECSVFGVIYISRLCIKMKLQYTAIFGIPSLSVTRFIIPGRFLA